MNAEWDARAVALLTLAFVAGMSLLQAAWLIAGQRWRRARSVLKRWRNWNNPPPDDAARERARQSGPKAPASAWGWPVGKARRLARLEAQLADGIDLVARALRAGHGLPQALRMVAQDGPKPLAEEFAVACDQMSFGIPADEALRTLAKRNPSDDLRCFVIAVVLQRETGGNLAEALDAIAALVRERQRLRQKVRALSAEGRFSAWILGLLPFALAASIAVINPGLISVLWTDPAGRAMSSVSLAMMLVGILAMREIVRIRI